METTLDQSKVISDEVASFFERERLLSPVINKKRKISTSTISPPTSLLSRSTASTSAVSVESFTATSVVEEAAELELPENIRSLETYTFIGFDLKTAAALWTRYVNHPNDDDGFRVNHPLEDDEFFDYAIWRIEGSNVRDVASDEDDWDATMIGWGINDKLRSAILLPEFDDLRYTATCKFWVLEAIKTNYTTLKEFDNRLRMHLARIHHAEKTPRTRKPGGSFSRPQSLSGPASSKVADDSPSLPSESPAEGNQPAPLVATKAAGPWSLPRHTIIWRATTRSKAQEFYNDATQAIALSAMVSAPGDFSRNQVVYWTPQKETADRYAQWLKHKAALSEIAIIQVAVPEAFTEQLAIKYLWFGEQEQPTDEWRKLIWCSPRGQRLPQEIRYIDQKDLLVGHIASGIHAKYVDMADYTRIRESDVLTVEIDGEMKRAVQWVFNTGKAEDGFEEHCRGKIWIHNLGALQVQHR